MLDTGQLFVLCNKYTSPYCFVSSRPPSEPLKAFILDEEPLEPLKCLFGPLTDFIFTFGPLFTAFSTQNLTYAISQASQQVFIPF